MNSPQLERIHQLIKRSKIAPDSVVSLLKNTLIGTEGSLYQLLDTETKIHSLHLPKHLYIERNGKAIGNVTFCERPVQINDEEFVSQYMRYFAFDAIFQGGTDKGKAQSGLHQYFKSLLETSNLDPCQPKFDKSIYWAFIDPQNFKSFNMNEQFGFQTIGSYHTKAFSRVHPKQHQSVQRIQENETDLAKNLIQKFYGGFNFFSDVHLFDNNDFFVLKVKGEIVAGIQANPSRFRIKSLPGSSGKFLIKALPYIPRLRKLIHPENHEFLATEGIFWKTGFENRITDLLEGVLHLTKHHSLLIWVDENNKMLNDLKIKWGFIQKTKKDNEIKIVAKFNGWSEAEIHRIKSSKKYLSGFDMT